MSFASHTFVPGHHIQEHVVAPQADLRRDGGVHANHIAAVSQQHVDLHLVILQSDEGQAAPHNAVEEEQKGNVEALDGARALAVDEVGHALVRLLLVGAAVQLVIHALVGGGDLVDALATDLHVHLLEEGLGRVVA